MAKKFARKLASMELEEKILNLGAFVALVGVFLPWIGGEWLGGDSVTHSGFGYYTGYMGITIAGLHALVLLITVVPLTGGPHLFKKDSTDKIRCLASIQATILTLAALSVLTKTTLDFARLEIRFGIYISLIGSLVTSLYTYLRYQEQQRKIVRGLFQYPEDNTHEQQDEEQAYQTPTPRMNPPKQSDAEEHKLYASQLR